MSLTVQIERTVGETRAAAYASDGRAFALFLERTIGNETSALLGDVHAARLASLSPEQGGGFADLESGESVFLRHRTLKGRAQGERFNVRIETEKRRGKAARGIVTDAPVCRSNAFETWLQGLPSEKPFELEEVTPGNAQIAAAFDEVFAPAVTLPGGGCLRISETPAIIAVDIDTAGRRDAGRAYDRALKINKIAAAETARQLSLRGLGGAVVLDCTGPLRKEHGTAVKQSLLQTFRRLSPRKIEALAPSPFGLMEAAIAWGRTPIGHVLLDDTGAPTPLTELQAAIRALEQALMADAAGTYVLELPVTHQSFWAPQQVNIERGLAVRYGRRFSIRASQNRESQVIKK